MVNLFGTRSSARNRRLDRAIGQPSRAVNQQRWSSEPTQASTQGTVPIELRLNGGIENAANESWACGGPGRFPTRIGNIGFNTGKKVGLDKVVADLAASERTSDPCSV